MKSRSFAPIARADASVLVLGTLPGSASLAEQQYYAHPRNAFWPIMGELFGASPELPYPERLEKLMANGIALWDVCHSAFRPGSLDSAIMDEKPNDIPGFLRSHPGVTRILFNGQPASRLFKKHILPRMQTDLPCITLPSTSPAHAGMRFEEKLKRWREALKSQR